MKSLDFNEMVELEGGSRATAVIGGAFCALGAVTAGLGSLGVGAAIFGPTCLAMIGITLWN